MNNYKKKLKLKPKKFSIKDDNFIYSYSSHEPRLQLNEAGWLEPQPLHLNESGWLVS